MKTKLSIACKKAGISPTKLAKLMGIGDSTCRRWARGENKPLPEYAKKAAKFLKTTPEKLF